MKDLTINQVICPCCNGHFPTFLSYGVTPRPNTKCPTCSSKGRHRLLWLYLKNKTNFFTDKLKVLHFAPEKCFEKVFASLPNLDYVTTDLVRKATINMDITDIPLDNNSFDVILNRVYFENHSFYRGLGERSKVKGQRVCRLPTRLD